MIQINKTHQTTQTIQTTTANKTTLDSIINDSISCASKRKRPTFKQPNAFNNNIDEISNTASTSDSNNNNHGNINLNANNSLNSQSTMQQVCHCNNVLSAI